MTKLNSYQEKKIKISQWNLNQSLQDCLALQWVDIDLLNILIQEKLHKYC